MDKVNNFIILKLKMYIISLFNETNLSDVLIVRGKNKKVRYVKYNFIISKYKLHN